MAMSSIHHSSALPFLSASILSPFFLSCWLRASSPSLLMQWQRHWVLCAPNIRVVLLSHLHWYWTGYQPWVCMHVLTWKRPSLPNNCISEPLCDTSAKKKKKKNCRWDAFAFMHTRIHSHARYFTVHISSSGHLSDSLFWVKFLHGEGEKDDSATPYGKQQENAIKTHIFYIHTCTQTGATYLMSAFQMINTLCQKLWCIISLIPFGYSACEKFIKGSSNRTKKVVTVYT